MRLTLDAAEPQDGSFDAVTCQYGLMFIMDHAAAMREAARVLRPSGLLAATVYGTEQQMQQVRPDPARKPAFARARTPAMGPTLCCSGRRP